MILLDLVQNIALLVMMAVAYRVLHARWGGRSTWDKVVLGLMFGGVAVVGMATPVRVMPGLIFDGRSIILAVSGFVGGPGVAVVSATVAGAYRYLLGGVGTAMGVGVVAEAAALGVLLNAYRSRSPKPLGLGALFMFGLAVHAVMFALIFTLPEPGRHASLVQVGPAVLTLYPVATVLVCRLFLDYEQREDAGRALADSYDRLDLALRGADLGIWDWDVVAGRVTVNARLTEMLGYGADELDLSLDVWEAMLHPDDRARARVALDTHLAGKNDLYEVEVRLRHKDGHWVWVLERGRVTERDEAGDPVRAAGTHLDITERKAAAEAVRESGERVHQQNRIVLGLMAGGDLFRDELRDSLRRITEAGAQLLETHRVGVWWYSDDWSVMRALDLYDGRTHDHVEGVEIATEALPEDLRRATATGPLAWSDVRADPKAGSLSTLEGGVGVRAMLAAPIWVHGEVAGGVSFGHVGEPRTWSPDDQRLAATVATLVSLCVEIRERKQAEATLRDRVEELDAAHEELRRREAFTRTVLDHLPMGIAVNSLDAAVTDIYVNDLFPDLYRTTREALETPEAFWEAAYEDPEFRERMKARITADMSSGDPERMHWEDVPITRASEETTFVSARNIPVPAMGLMISTVWDVTARKRAEEALGESEERFRRLAENNPDVIFRYRVSSAQGHGFEYLSPAVEDLTGYPPEAFYDDAEQYLKLTHPDDRGRTNVPDTPGVVAPVVVRWIRKDGGVIWVEIRRVAIADGEGKVVAVEGIARDVTERVHHDREIRMLADSLELKVRERTLQLEAANEELEAFSYSVSHDLKAPLRAVDGYSALLEEGTGHGADAEGRRLVGQIRANVQQMGRLIDDLLALSRAGRAPLASERVDVGPIVREIMNRELQLAPGRGIELTLGDIPPVEGDFMLLRQALDNVLGNAVKFTEPREVARIEVTGHRANKTVEITVRDNGVGFDPRYRHKLFRTFERLHYQDEFPGTGVGLAIVKRIVERHRGRVTAESELDVGTVVRLTLPALREAPESPEEEAQ